MSRDHRKLRAFEFIDALVMDVDDITQTFPKEELYVLTAQMRRAALSSAANIVEGCARDGHAEYLHFLSVSLASMRELGYFLTVAARRKYVDPHRVRANET